MTLSKGVVNRAMQIVGSGGVLLSYNTPGGCISQFSVKQRNDKYTDVWRVERHGVVKWSCNAVRDKVKDGVVYDRYGCVFNTCERNAPFCSHTLAAHVFFNLFNRREVNV